MSASRGSEIVAVVFAAIASGCARAEIVEAPMTPPQVSSTTLSASDGGAEPVAMAAIAFVAGDRFQGHYFCAQGRSELVLTIAAMSGDDVTATFAFNVPPSRSAGAVAGSYRMRGTFDADTRRLTLEGDSWIEEPAGYVMVDLEGELTPQGGLRGTVTGAPGCTTFTLDPPRRR